MFVLWCNVVVWVRCVTLCGQYQQVHHVGLVVAQGFDGVKHVDRALMPQHFTHDTDGTKRPAATAAVPDRSREKDIAY